MAIFWRPIILVTIPVFPNRSFQFLGGIPGAYIMYRTYFNIHISLLLHLPSQILVFFNVFSFFGVHFYSNERKSKINNLTTANFLIYQNKVRIFCFSDMICLNKKKHTSCFWHFLQVLPACSVSLSQWS